MNISTKLLQAAAGAAGGASLDVDEVFSTFVADATGSGSLTINNGIALGSGTSLVGKTITNLGSSFDGSYPLSNINDGVVETSNAQNIAYTSGTFDIYVDMGSAVILNAYFLAPQGDQGGSTYNNPTGFTVSGSNNASSWTTIQTFSSITGFAAGSFKTFEFTNTTSYRYYRLAASNTGVSLSEWKVRTSDDTGGEGGIVWVKSRNNAHNHYIFDPSLGSGAYLQPNNTASLATGANYSFTSTGLTDAYNNYSGNEAVWWTFRKAPKFFDVVTYTGDGSSNFSKKVSHNLGQRPGMVFVKNTSASSNWLVWYPLMDSSAYNLNLNTNNQSQSSNETNGRAYVESSGDYRLQVSATGTGVDANKSGDTYVAYFFAHNNNDGEFGPDSDQDIVKCGSFTTSSSSNTNVEINLGFEPQWLLLKTTSVDAPWNIVDNMRGFTFDGTSPRISADSANSESEGASNRINIRSNGFSVNSTQYGTSENMIYMAIRRGPLAVPEDATKVFAVAAGNSGSAAPLWQSNFVVDMGLQRNTSSTADWNLSSRLTSGKFLETNTTDAEGSQSNATFDFMDGWYNSYNFAAAYSWMWKRAPSYFDVVAYTGGGYNTNVKHNLTVTPELCIAKSRTTNSVVDDWYVWSSHSGDGNDTFGFLNSNGTTGMGFHASSPSATDLYLHGNVAYSGYPYIMYLFATVAGVSKVGSFTINNADITVDCGFSSGARFVLIKRSSGTDDWYVFDTVRGYVSGSGDAALKLNSTAAESSSNMIDPHASGFSLRSAAWYNGDYIFYAIA